MGGRIEADVSLTEIKFLEELYPRSTYNWQTAYDYSQSILAGATMPRITLAILDGEKILVDGKHRLEAHKLAKLQTVPAEIFEGWDKKKIYLESIKRNIIHGRPFSPYEKRMAILKLRELSLTEEEVSKLIQIPQAKLQHFVAQRLVSAVTGEIISEVVLKSTLKDKAGGYYSREELDKLESLQEPLYEKTQNSIVDNLIHLIENNLLDVRDENIEKSINKLYFLIGEKYFSNKKN